jgi:hypothetical protein
MIVLQHARIVVRQRLALHRRKTVQQDERRRADINAFQQGGS